MTDNKNSVKVFKYTIYKTRAKSGTKSIHLTNKAKLPTSEKFIRTFTIINVSAAEDSLY